MPSCSLYPTYRFDWQPDARIILAGTALAGLAVLGISTCGLSLCLRAVLILIALVYAAFGLWQYARQRPVQFEIMAQGPCQIHEEGKTQLFGELSWRDWGYLIELSGNVNGKTRTWFWLSCHADATSCRAMRLLIRSRAQKAKPGLPSIITNPVL